MSEKKVWDIALLMLLTIMIVLTLILFIKKADDLETIAKKCDQTYGHTCSYYEIRQYRIGK